ncbi:MAG: nitroreductase family deazaflavin-dependent oxidoreductase [Actinomycetota bacterium]
MVNNGFDQGFSESPFPDGRWGRSDSKLAGPLKAFAATGIGSRTIRALVPIDTKILMKSNGRFTVLGPFGLPLLLLTTVGRKSGYQRTTPLVYLPSGEALIVVGSNFGQERHPAWALNLAAWPEANVSIKGEVFSVTATELNGDARTDAFERFVAMAKTYDAYRHRTDRAIKVFSLQKLEI